MSTLGTVPKVFAFPTKGNLVGFDALCKNKYLSEPVALTDCELVFIPASNLFSPGRGASDTERMIYWAITKEIVNEQANRAEMHSVNSKYRLVKFLITYLEKSDVSTKDAFEFIFPMSSIDLSNYLGVPLEIISENYAELANLELVLFVGKKISIPSYRALLGYFSGLRPG